MNHTTLAIDKFLGIRNTVAPHSLMPGELAGAFSGLEPGVDDYYVVAIDAPFNALIYDKVAAI